MSDPHSSTPWLPLAILALALMIWGSLLALGAYLQVSADEPLRDARKAWVVLGCTASFLAFWGAALWFRARKR